MAVASRVRRTPLVIVLGIVVLSAILWERYAERNDGRAYFSFDAGIYRVEMTGWRFPMVHDPISLVIGRTRRTTLALGLPRIEGVVDGSEIRVDPDKYAYTGRVVMSDGRMKVDLFYPDGSPLPWNGDYTLVQRDSGRTR